MRFRPWPIVILALCHFLAPFANLFFSAWLQGVGISAYLYQFRAETGFWGYVDFFLVLPLAGAAIYACKKWSYPIFLAAALETVGENYWAWRQHPGQFPLVLFLALAVLDVAFVGYFLLPAVRAPYLDPKLRWWESKKRFVVRARAWARILSDGRPDVRSDGQVVRGVIADLSAGGVMFRTLSDLPPDSRIVIQFSVLGRPFALECRVVHRRKGRVRAYGLEFVHTQASRAEVRRLVRALGLMRFSFRNQEDRLKDFARWCVTLITTGRGIVPETQRRKPKLTIVPSLPSTDSDPNEDQSHAA